MAKEKPIPHKEWRSIVENIPLVSVDLIVEHDGGVLLGKREYEPAKDEWFVPGGTVLKNEPRTDAVHRVADEELGAPVVIDECLGTFEHFNDTSEIEGAGSKHHVATGYHYHFEFDDLTVSEDDQHGAYKRFRLPFDGFHPYVQRYLDCL